jgi:glycine/D-amino acid oxidase-like deaminating enzyme/nitrite reductase/ring-hydroxylating ferredoxin subunit
MTQLPGVQESYWIETTPATDYPPPEDGLETDVAVVGGGIAGLCTARELARRGKRVAVLEADRIAAGVTGYTTAKVSSLHSLVYASLRRTRGEEGARLYATSQQDAVEHVVATAEELGVDCDLERAPAYTYVRDPAHVDQVRAEAAAARAAGLPAAFVTTTGLPFPVAGAVRVEDQAQFHPRKYLLALAADLVAHGGAVHERTRVTGLEEGSPCRLTTEHGTTVVARDVVVATHYPVFDRSLLFAKLSPHRELVVAAPLAAERDPGGMYITPEENKRSVRTAPGPDGRRLLIVTGESFLPGTADSAERFEVLLRWTERYFPGAAVSHRWATQDNDPTDTVPCVGRLHPGARHTWVATGFGGWGMSGGVMAGKLLAARIDGGPQPEWTALYEPFRPLATAREGGAFLQHQATVAKHFAGDRLRPSHADSVEDVAPGTGAVVRSGGRHRAVYRDEDGTVHTVSARCTHMGCLVAFNTGERAWECPCHGSRFGVDGSVVQGPAVAPLTRLDED